MSELQTSQRANIYFVPIILTNLLPSLLTESDISWSRLRRHHRVQVCHLLPGEAAVLE